MAGIGKLDPKVKTLWRIKSFLNCAILGAILLIIDLAVRKSIKMSIPFGILSGGIALINMVRGQLIVNKSYEIWEFQKLEQEIRVKQGVFYRSEKSIPRQRIQYVDVTSGAIERMLGLSEVRIFTAADQVEIPGIPTDEAEKLRDELLHHS